MLNPILSRFCEIYVPDNINNEGHTYNLHQYHLNNIYVYFLRFDKALKDVFQGDKRLLNFISGSVASTKFNRFQLKKFKCHKINSIENQHFSYLSDTIFLKEKQKNRQMRQNLTRKDIQ